MEDKQQLVVDDRRRKSTYLHSISILVLSVLVSACVGTIIYLSLYSPADCKALPESISDTSITSHQNFNLVREDGSKFVEEVDYDEKRQISILHKPGAFQINDFRRGIDIVKDMETGGCYVLPVGTDEKTSKDHAAVMRSYHGEELMDPGNKTYYVYIVPGAIEDTSFLPPEADEECSEYHWGSILDEVSAEGAEGAEGGLVRYKRGFFSKVWRSVKKAVKKVGDVVVDVAKDAVKTVVVGTVVSGVSSVAGPVVGAVAGEVADNYLDKLR